MGKMMSWLAAILTVTTLCVQAQAQAEGSDANTYYVRGNLGAGLVLADSQEILDAAVTKIRSLLDGASISYTRVEGIKTVSTSVQPIESERGFIVLVQLPVVNTAVLAALGITFVNEFLAQTAYIIIGYQLSEITSPNVYLNLADAEQESSPFDFPVCQLSSTLCDAGQSCVNTVGAAYRCDGTVYMAMTLGSTYNEAVASALSLTVMNAVVSHVQFFIDTANYSLSVHSYSGSDTFLIILKMDLKDLKFHRRQLETVILTTYLQSNVTFTLDDVVYPLVSAKLYTDASKAENAEEGLTLHTCYISQTLCPFLTRCVPTDSRPRCEEICDRGYYHSGVECVTCGEGMTTLVSGARSSDMCIDTCQPGESYSLVNQACAPCRPDYFRSATDPFCQHCLYDGSDSTSCPKGTEYAEQPRRIDIKVTVNLVISFCDPLQGNNELLDYSLSALIKSIMLAGTLYGKSYSTALCLTTTCDNVLIRTNGRPICVPDCAPGITDCDRLVSTIDVMVLNIWDRASLPGQEYNRSSADILLEYLYDFEELYNTFTSLSISNVDTPSLSFEAPFVESIQTVEHYERRVINITLHIETPPYASGYLDTALHRLVPIIMPFLSNFGYVEIQSKDSLTADGSTHLYSIGLVFLSDINAETLNDIATYLAKAQKSVGGSFIPNYHLLKVVIFTPEELGLPAVVWCPFMQSLSLNPCSGNSTCRDIDNTWMCDNGAVQQVTYFIRVEFPKTFVPGDTDLLDAVVNQVRIVLQLETFTTNVTALETVSANNGQTTAVIYSVIVDYYFARRLTQVFVTNHVMSRFSVTASNGMTYTMTDANVFAAQDLAKGNIDPVALDVCSFGPSLCPEAEVCTSLSGSNFDCNEIDVSFTYFIRVEFPKTFVPGDTDLLDAVVNQVRTVLQAETFGSNATALKAISANNGQATAVIYSVTLDNAIDTVGLTQVFVRHHVVSKFSVTAGNGVTYTMTDANVFLVQILAELNEHPLDLDVCNFELSLCPDGETCLSLSGSDYNCGENSITYFIRVEFPKTFVPGDTDLLDAVVSQVRIVLQLETFGSNVTALEAVSANNGQTTAVIYSIMLDDVNDTPRLTQIFVTHHIVSLFRVTANNGVTYTMTDANVFAVLDLARLNSNPLDLDVCSFGQGLCPDAALACSSLSGSGFSCVDVCGVNRYKSNGQCLSCLEGQITLNAVAASADDCRDLCPAGEGFSWISLSCVPCPSGYYSDALEPLCLYCSPQSSSRTSCSYPFPVTATDVNQVDLTIQIDFTLENCNGLDLNNRNETDEGLNQLVRDAILQITQGTSGLCIPDGDCRNLVAQLDYNNIQCTPGGGTALSRLPITLNFYNIWEVVVTTTGDRRDSVEVVLDALHLWSNYASSAATAGSPRFELPPKSTSSDSAEVERRQLLVTVNLNLAFDPKYANLENEETQALLSRLRDAAYVVFGVIDDFLYVEFEEMGIFLQDNQRYIQFNSSFVFKHVPNDINILELAKGIARSHEYFGRTFDITDLSLIGEVYIYKSREDLINRVSAVRWCSILDQLEEATSFSFCGPEEECHDTELFFECRRQIPTITTEAPDTDPTKAQRDLFPYGESAGDSLIVGVGENEWDYWSASSETIQFPSGVSIGPDKFTSAHVLPNGVITFGDDKWAWYPDLEWSYIQGQVLLAPYWCSMDPRAGQVFYQLYQRLGSPESTHLEVLNRASQEVQEYLIRTSDANTKFEALTVLVATWVNVEPHSWYSYYCQHKNEFLEDQWVQDIYPTYCAKETNTFQLVFISDGQRSFALTTYKEGAMKWKYEKSRYIAVGYTTLVGKKDLVVNGTELTTQLDRLLGNTGRYGTWMFQVGLMESTDARCEMFYLANEYLITDERHNEMIRGLLECPCTMDRIGVEWSWLEEKAVSGEDRTYIACLAISSAAKRWMERLQGNTLNRLCCYKYVAPNPDEYVYADGSQNWEALDEAWIRAYQDASYIFHNDPEAGHLLLFDPWSWSESARLSAENDFNPHRYCCKDSTKLKSCALFNMVRPDAGCNPNVTFISAWIFGDPHVNTLDGLDYTFNGLGEYWLLKVQESDIAIQARTRQPMSSTGVLVNATVFVVLAMSEGDVNVQVELDDRGTGMVILDNGVDITNAFNQADGYPSNYIRRKVRNSDGKPVVEVTLPSSISIDVSVGVQNLEFSIKAPVHMRGKTLGLLGNFDGDQTNDFVLPSGVPLSASDTDSQRKILNNFAEEWRITVAESVFTYDDAENSLNYQNTTFVPMFIDEEDPALQSRAEATCGKDQTCIFDLIATESEEFAKHTQRVNIEGQAVKVTQANSPPSLLLDQSQLNANQQWEVNQGLEATLTFTGQDTDGDDFTFALVTAPTLGLEIDQMTGVLTYTPDRDTPVRIGVQAHDTKGGSSPVMYVTVALCPSCSGHGNCIKTQGEQVTEVSDKFIIFPCTCQPAYTGVDCSQEVDGCASRPCAEQSSCTNLDPTQEVNRVLRFYCGSCPVGYVSREGICADENECVINGLDPCPSTSDCVNTEGSFLCRCKLGYRANPGDQIDCIDIDECFEGTHTCEQVCENTDGAYRCSCLPGNTLTSDDRTCTQDASSTDACNTKGCDHVCSVDGSNTATCSCRKGYQLDGETQCVDVDECDADNSVCSQQCTNLPGGFSCSCYPGFTLDFDRTSCTKCKDSFYGVDCLTPCVCNGQGRCDHVRGCDCQEGWMGPHCDRDVDECANQDSCTLNKVCVNTPGSFECICRSGYDLVNGNCQDVDECLDVLSHNCSLGVEDCLNTEGGFSCPCRSGYARNQASGICEDIDECASHTDQCVQICENTIGSYNCKCAPGYRLDTNRLNCVQSTDVCEGVTDLNCQHICTVDPVTNQAKCMCRDGYELDGTENCKDIDECDPRFPHRNLCQNKPGCLNTDGGFNCSCPVGQMLDNNLRSCLVCDNGRWGVECAFSCSCSSGASRCDPVRGCVCKPGLKGLHCEEDLDECETGVLTCGQTEICVNTIGSASCQCREGYHRSGDDCIDVDECSDIADNDCDQVCENFPGGYRCTCHTGYSYDETERLCRDIHECEVDVAGCEDKCVNTEGGFRCECEQGMLNSDRLTCTVGDAYVCDPSNTCQEKCTLVNGQPTCSCEQGKEIDPNNVNLCRDKNLCAPGQHPCSDGCQEVDNGRNIQCTCPDGRRLSADGFLCEECTEGTFGAGCAQNCTCDYLNTDYCDKVMGTCMCKTGWETATCAQDVNECNNAAPCAGNRNCMNTPGSFVCTCSIGYFTNGNTCTECTDNKYGIECQQTCDCDLGRITSCSNIDGQCQCQAGWEGTRCDTDIDECADQNNQCAQQNRDRWICFNEPGAFRCDCETGYTDNNGVCTNLDECASTSTNQCEHICTDTEGSYTCSCRPGYQVDPSNVFACIDIDECTATSPCQQLCTNTDGSFTCSCGARFAVDESDATLCFEALRATVELVLALDVSGMNLRERAGPDYISLEAQMSRLLLEKFRELVREIKYVIINSLREGSLIIDATTIVDNSQGNSLSASAIVDSLVLLAANGLVVNGSQTSVTVQLGALTVTTNSDKCAVMEAIETCPSGQQCELEAGSAVCRSSASTSDDYNVPLIVGLCVGISLAVGIIVAVAIVINMKLTARKERRRVESREGHYNEAGPESHYYSNASTPDFRSPSALSKMSWKEEHGQPVA